MPSPSRPTSRLRLVARPRERNLWAALNVLPLPGLGALLAGRRNPHTRLARRGAFQMTLVVLGSWPLVLPGAAGLAWAAWDAVRIGRASLLPWPEGQAPPATQTVKTR